MEWMRCNSCFLRIGTKQSMFHLTQCGHVYCEKCIAKAEERCCQCGSTGTISLPLKEPLSPQIAHFFTPMNDLLDKVIQAGQFQQAQLSISLKRGEETDNKYQALKEAYWASAENLKKLHQKYNKMKTNLIAMQKNSNVLNASVINFTPTKSQYYTPPSHQNTNQQNYPRGYINQENQNNLKSNEHVFRVPIGTKVPKSAGSQSANSGYYTGSTTLSNSRINSSISNASNY